MARLDFGYWDAIGMYEMERVGSVADVYDEHIRLAEKLEGWGYHSYWIIEHQNSPVGHITSPTVFLTAVARATTRLRVGAMIWLIPFHHPMRLAQEVAMLDQLSRGRVEFGTGLGVHEHEFLRWGLDYYKRAPMAGEALEIIKQAWTQDEVTYKGEFWQFDEALPKPKPFQQPYPPIWSAAHSKAALEFAARNNYHVAQNIDTDAVVAEKFDYFREVWRSCSHPGPMPRIFLQRNVHVAETDELAREEAEHYVMNARLAGYDVVAQTRIGWGSNPRGMGRDSSRPDDVERGRVFSEASKSYEFSIENGLSIVGSPETVIRKLQEGQQRIGYDLFCANHSIGGMPHDLVMKSNELFGREVVPAFAG